MSLLFFEIGFEEFPCTYIQDVQDQLSSRLKTLFEEYRLVNEQTNLNVWATPRRLIVQVSDILSCQEDYGEVVYGPPIKVARNVEGHLTVAGQSFLKRNNISLEVLSDRKDSKGRLCLSFDRLTVGKKLTEIFPLIFEKILTSLKFPKSMRFLVGDSFRFARPLRWFVVIIDGVPSHFSFKGLTSSSFSYSIRQGASFQKFKIQDVRHFEKDYFANGVIVDSKKRRSKILDRMKEVLDDQGLVYDFDQMIDSNLLNDVVMSVEDVDVLVGSFDKKYLKLPDIVLLEVMKSHHKFFPVFDPSLGLQPYFLSVLNGKKDDSLVRRGNERVLKARYEDALFFLKEDLGTRLEVFSDRLSDLVFHQSIGSYQVKVDKMKNLVSFFEDHFNWTSDQVHSFNRAVLLCKSDLLTSMVYELPDLQGKMGAYYAREQGEPEAVCSMIHHQYFSLDDIKNEEDVLFALIDHLSNFILGFNARLKVSGSSDPYGLRRDCIFVVESFLKYSLDVDLFVLIDQYVVLQDQKDQAYRFVLERVRQVFMSRYSFSRSCVNALLSRCHQLKLSYLLNLGRVVMDTSFHDQLQRFCQSFLRIKKIIRDYSSFECDEDFFVCSEEKDLFLTYLSIQEDVKIAYENHDAVRILSLLSSLFLPIQSLFDKVMIMDKDEKIRQNRLSLLFLVNQLGDYLIDCEALDLFIGEGN